MRSICVYVCAVIWLESILGEDENKKRPYGSQRPVCFLVFIILCLLKMYSFTDLVDSPAKVLDQYFLLLLNRDAYAYVGLPRWYYWFKNPLVNAGET